MGLRGATHAGSSMSRGAASFALSMGSVAARGGAGSALSCNGLLLMAAARGRRSLLSVRWEFPQDPGVISVIAYAANIYLNLRKSLQREEVGGVDGGAAGKRQRAS